MITATTYQPNHFEVKVRIGKDIDGVYFQTIITVEKGFSSLEAAEKFIASKACKSLIKLAEKI